MKIKKNIDNIHDKSYKDFLSKKEVFLNMMNTFIDEKWISSLDSNNLTLIDKEFILEDYEEI